MSAVEWLLWLTAVSLTFVAFCAIDAPTLCARATNRLINRIFGGTR